MGMKMTITVRFIITCVQEVDEEEEKADQIGVVQLVGEVCQDAADDLARAGLSESAAHTQGAGKQERHGPVDSCDGLLLGEHTEENHGESAGNADDPGFDLELGLEDEGSSCKDEDSVAGLLLKGGQRGLVVLAALDFGGLNYRGIGSEFGSEEDAVDHDHDEPQCKRRNHWPVSSR